MDQGTKRVVQAVISNQVKKGKIHQKKETLPKHPRSEHNSIWLLDEREKEMGRGNQETKETWIGELELFAECLPNEYREKRRNNSHVRYTQTERDPGLENTTASKGRDVASTKHKEIKKEKTQIVGE